MNDTYFPAFDSPEDELRYFERVKWLEAHPDNQSGADKTWVEQAQPTKLRADRWLSNRTIALSLRL